MLKLLMLLMLLISINIQTSFASETIEVSEVSEDKVEYWVIEYPN